MSGFTRIYPRNEALLFDGGLNNKFERSIIEDNESPDCANVIFDNGSVATRDGTSKLNTAAVGSFACDGLYTRKDNSGAETMIVFMGGTMWGLSGTSFATIGSAQSVFTASNRVVTAQYENHMFIGNGGVIPYKWNGTDFTRHGVYPPTTTHSVATAGTGAALSGVYGYKITFVNSQLVESNVGPAVTFTAALENASLTSIPVAVQSWGVSSRKIYRTTDGGSTYKLLTTLSDNTTTTYEDGVSDASLGATAPTDNGVPPKYNACCYMADRLFMNDPSTPNLVWYSELGQPYTVASTNFLKAGDKSGDIVRTLTPYDNSVLVGCDSGQYLIYMPTTDASGWLMIKLNSSFGSKSQFCNLRIDNKVLFGAMQGDKFVGFAMISGDALEPSATQLTVSSAGSFLKTDRLEPDMFQVPESIVGDISGIVYKNKAYITLPYGSGATANNRIYVMDFSISNLKKNQKESWVPWTGLSAEQFTIYNGDLYYASSTATGFVYKINAGVYSDDGSAIDSYYWTKEYSGYDDEKNFDKDWRYANVLVEMLGAWNMDVAYRTNSDNASGTATVVYLDPGGSKWGTLTWGTDDWGGGQVQSEKRVFLGTSRGKRIQIKFGNQNTAGQAFKVHRMNLLYIRRGYR